MKLRLCSTLLVLLSTAPVGATPATPVTQPAPPTLSSTSPATEGVYAKARTCLLQIRTLLKGAGRQSSIGSGFLVGADGLAITNYHVVSQFALEPATYSMEYAAPDGSSGALTLLAVDVANDLAVVRIDRTAAPDLPFLEFDSRALAAALPKGERLYSMGNPLDLGFTIVEGTNNGPVERNYGERIHFTGAINPGMSGGPAVAADGRVVGVNVAKRLDGELVSFLVPARFAAALLERARTAPALAPDAAKAEIGHQFAARQAALYEALQTAGLREADAGPYRAAESAAPWFTCWSRTNADEVPKPKALVDSTSCHGETALFVTDDVYTGHLELTHAYVRSDSLNAFQFATALSSHFSSGWSGGWFGRKRLTAPLCHEHFVATDASRPPLRATWCARAYRDFDGLYDVALSAVTQDRRDRALVVRLTMHGVGYEPALAAGKRYLEALQWAP